MEISISPVDEEEFVRLIPKDKRHLLPHHLKQARLWIERMEKFIG